MLFYNTYFCQKILNQTNGDTKLQQINQEKLNVQNHQLNEQYQQLQQLQPKAASNSQAIDSDTTSTKWRSPTTTMGGRMPCNHFMNLHFLSKKIERVVNEMTQNIKQTKH